MRILHLTSSTFFGGPERQMLGLARSMPQYCQSFFCSFLEGGRCQAFIQEAQRRGYEATALQEDTPRLWAALQELRLLLRDLNPDVVCCHGYKANLMGLLAARGRRIPIIAVSRGWTSENRKVRFYEKLDRLVLRWMDRVVCVSAGQADHVRGAGVAADRITVIHNAIRVERFKIDSLHARQELCRLFPKCPSFLVGAAGRLSPEKGFSDFVEAARLLTQRDASLGFVLFGEGVLRSELERQVARAELTDRFLLPGFRPDLDSLLPGLDVLVQSSFTEGLPNILLEASACRVPVVATAVGGTPEVIEDGVNGYLVKPGDSFRLAAKVAELLACEDLRKQMGRSGRKGVRDLFTFEAQAESYLRTFNELLGQGSEKVGFADAFSEENQVSLFS
jgi:glycosyltransferase involved in cell wall biosynthesis